MAMRQPEAKTPQLCEVMLLCCVIVPARALSNGGILTGNKLMLRINGQCALLYAAILKKEKKSYLFVMFALKIFSLISYTTQHLHTHTLVLWGHSTTRFTLYSLCDLAYWTMDFQVRMLLFKSFLCDIL